MIDCKPKILHPTTEPDPPLHLHLFGAFALGVQGQEISNPTRPVKWLLALLALRRAFPLSREWLAETLWSEAIPERSSFYLRRSLTELRTALGAQRHRLTAPTRATLAFDFTHAFCDVIAFDRLVSSTEDTHLEAAVALYRGNLLEGWDAEWLTPERERRREQFITALERLAARREERADWAGAAQLLRRLVEADPLREKGQRRLMQALGRAGDYSGVERQYRQLCHALHNELNMQPDQETVELHRKLMQVERQPAILSAPTRRAPVTDTIRFDNVPHPLGELIGREKAQAEIQHRLRTERMMTLTGTGGVGKTRLALALARAYRKNFAHGVVWIELAALTSAAQVAQAIAAVLHLSERRGETTLHTVTNYLRSRQLLLVLDNCEHLLEACAELSRALLDACVNLHIIATSRQALGLFGECVWTVPSLNMPPSEALAAAGNVLQQVEASDAARLFVMRAREASADFRLTEANAVAIARICWKLEGIPLALELAAVWVRALSPGQLVQHLEDSLTLLQRGDPTADPRHRTLCGTMDWSYGLLGNEEQTLLARLAIFAGGWTLEALRAVCFESDDSGQALLLLETLIRMSLVEVGERNGEAWYRLLEPVRQYAWKRLVEATEEQKQQRRHQAYFLALAEQLALLLEGPHTVETMERMAADYDNFRAALRFSLNELGEGNVGDSALRLATALSQFQCRRGYYQEGLEGLEEALKRSSASQTASLHGEALLSAGVIAVRMGDMHLMQTYTQAAEAFYRRLPDSSGLVRSLRVLGTLMMWKKDYASATAILEEGMMLARQIGDRDNEARLQAVLGILARLQGALVHAKALQESAIHHFKEASLLADEAVARHNLAVSLLAAGAQREAKQHFLRSLEIHRRIGNRAWIGINLFDVGRIALLEGNLAEARELGKEALALCRAGDMNMVPLCLQLLANVERQAGNLGTARTYLEEAITLQQQADIHYDTAGLVIGIGYLLRDEGRHLLGAELLAALVTSQEMKDTWLATPYAVNIEELWQAFRDALGEEGLEEAKNRAQTATLSELLAAALESGQEQAIPAPEITE